MIDQALVPRACWGFSYSLQVLSSLKMISGDRQFSLLVDQYHTHQSSWVRFCSPLPTNNINPHNRIIGKISFNSWDIWNFWEIPIRQPCLRWGMSMFCTTSRIRNPTVNRAMICRLSDWKSKTWGLQSLHRTVILFFDYAHDSWDMPRCFQCKLLNLT